jgi:pimeloyl-ACP methyl ester carboxylesterase
MSAHATTVASPLPRIENRISVVRNFVTNPSRTATMKLPRRQFLHLPAGAFALQAVSRVATAQSYPVPPLRPLAGKWGLVIATNGEAKLRVFTAGEGPTIVMLPARGLGPFELEPLAERLLPAGFRVVLPEPRGYGESSGPLNGVTMNDLAADVAQAIESAGGKPVVVVGHAFGNRVGRMLAQDRPDLIRAVVLIAAGGKFPPKPAIAPNLKIWLDETLPPAQRTAAAKAAFFGPRT